MVARAYRAWIATLFGDLLAGVRLRSALPRRWLTIACDRLLPAFVENLKAIAGKIGDRVAFAVAIAASYLQMDRPGRDWIGGFRGRSHAEHNGVPRILRTGGQVAGNRSETGRGKKDALGIFLGRNPDQQSTD